MADAVGAINLGDPDNAGTTTPVFLALSGTYLSIAGAVILGDANNSGTANPAPFSLSATALLSAAISGDLDFLPLTMDGGSLEGPMRLPQLSLSATLASGTVAIGAAVLQMQLDAMLLPGGTLDGSLGLPNLTLEASTGVRGDLLLLPALLAASGSSGNVLTGALLLTSPDLMATGLSQLLASATLDLLVPTLDASAVTGGASAGNALLLPLTLTASLNSENQAAAQLALPAMTLAANVLASNVLTGNPLWLAPTLSATLTPPPANRTATGDVQLLAATLTATALTGTVASGAISLPAALLNASALAQGQAAGALQWATFTLQGTAGASNVIVGNVLLTLPTLDASDANGNTAVAALTLPLLTLRANGAFSTVGSASLRLPLLQLDGALIQVLSNPVFTGIVVNTRNASVSTFSGIQANSFASFAGLTLAATASGIVALTGDTDLGAAINAEVTSGISDLNSEQAKRVLAGYVGYRADGALELTLITDGHHEYVYALLPRRLDDPHASRVKLGRGVDGRYWQFKLTNKNGANFNLDSLALDVLPISRRVR